MVKHTETICLSVLEHFVGLAPKGLKTKFEGNPLDIISLISFDGDISGVNYKWQILVKPRGFEQRTSCIQEFT